MFISQAGQKRRPVIMLQFAHQLPPSLAPRDKTGSENWWNSGQSTVRLATQIRELKISRQDQD